MVPAFAVVVPPMQLELKPLGLATTRPLGSKSVKATPSRLTGFCGPVEVRESSDYCFVAPRAPERHELHTPKPLPLPTMAAHRPPRLASSLWLRVDAVKAFSVVA